MDVPDFGKNVYQCELVFKMDCLSADSFRQIAQHHAKASPSSYLGKDEQAGLELITTGLGTKEQPYLQIRLGSNKIILWAGWYAPYDKWKLWRNKVVHELTELLQIPSLFVASIVSQSTLIIPRDRLNKNTEIPEFQPLVQFVRRFVPEQFLGRSGGYSVFGNEPGTQTVEWQSGGNPATMENTIAFAHRWLAVEPQASLQENILKHCASFDTLFDLFNSRYLILLLKK